jgi:hypothetical protein
MKTASLKGPSIAVNSYDIIRQKLEDEEHQLILLDKHQIIEYKELVG